MTSEIKQPKRGAYKKKECPYCGKMVGNLGNHVKMAHPREAAAAVAPPAITKEDLINPGAVKREAPVPTVGDTTYYCQDCKAELRKGETECWHCGEKLLWEGVE